MRAALIAAAALATPGVAAAEDDLQLWTTLNIGGTIVGPIDANLELSARSAEGVDRLGVTFIRPTVGLRLGEAVTAWVGYAEVTTRLPGRPRVNEDRYFQQLTMPVARLGRTTLSTRLRLEQRTIDGSNDLGWRGRALMRATRATRPGGVSLVGSSELFVGLNRTGWGAVRGFDQLRSFAGVSIPVSRAVTVETGFLHRVQRFRSVPERHNYVLPVVLNLRF